MTKSDSDFRYSNNGPGTIVNKNSKNYRSDANQKPSFLQSVQPLHTNTLTHQHTNIPTHQQFSSLITNY